MFMKHLDMKHFQGSKAEKLEGSFTKAKGDQFIDNNFMYILKFV